VVAAAAIAPPFAAAFTASSAIAIAPAVAGADFAATSITAAATASTITAVSAALPAGHRFWLLHVDQWGQLYG
jgi:hypothetical protein